MVVMQRQVELCELKVSLVYKESFRAAKTVLKNTVLKTKNKQM